MIRCIWALALFCSTHFLHAQTRAQLQSFADVNFAEGNLEVALLHYNRLLFHAPTSQEVALLNYNVASCYFLMGNYDLAGNYFDFAFYASEEDSMQTEAVLGKTRTLMRQELWTLALFELANLSPESPDFENTIALYTGLCHFHQNEFEEALTYFNQLLVHDSLARMQATELLTNRRLLYRPNPELARWLSFVPGTGQFYAGDIKNGLNSLLLNAGLFALGFNIVQNYALVDAVISVLPWLQRYYLGGTEAAERIATSKRQQNRQLALSEVLDLIQAAQVKKMGTS